MAAVVNWQIPVFHVFPFFAPCIAIFSTMRYPSATSSTIITLKPTAKKHRADVRVPPLRHFRDQRLHHHIQHGSGGKAEQIGQGGHHDACRQDRQHCPDRTENVPSNDAFSVSPSSSFLPPIAVHDSAFHLGNFQLLRKSNGQYRRQLPLPQPRSAPVCFAFSAPASRSARTTHLQALAAPKTGCARPIACRLQRRHRYS